jgi:hypothetical protein
MIPGNLPVGVIALPVMGALLGGLYNSPDLVGSRLNILLKKRLRRAPQQGTPIKVLRRAAVRGHSGV